MASGAHVATTGMRRSCGGVAALADLGPGRRLGDTRLLEPDSAATAFPMRCLALLLIFGADVVRTGRRWWTALGRRMPWRDHEAARQVPVGGTALERRLSRQLIAAGPSVRRLRRGATLVEQGAPGHELFLVLQGWLAVEVDGERVGRVGPGAILGELAVLEHDIMVVGVVPARLRDAAGLLAMAARLGANPYRVAARLDHWQFGPTVALIVAKVPVEQFRQVRPRLGIVEEELSLQRRPGRPGRRTATLRALTSCRVAVVPDGVLDREVLAELARADGSGRQLRPRAVSRLGCRSGESCGARRRFPTWRRLSVAQDQRPRPSSWWLAARPSGHMGRLAGTLPLPRATASKRNQSTS